MQSIAARSSIVMLRVGTVRLGAKTLTRDLFYRLASQQRVLGFMWPKLTVGANEPTDVLSNCRSEIAVGACI